LLLRLLLLIALALFLAKPVSMQTASPTHWVVVVPGADIDAAKDLTANKKSEWHWLTPGFPDFQDKPITADLNIGSLLRELDAQLPANTAITVLLPDALSGLDGERIRLSRKIEWKSVGTENPGEPPA